MADDSTPPNSGKPTFPMVRQRIQKTFEDQRDQTGSSEYPELEKRWEPVLSACDNYTQMWTALPQQGDDPAGDVFRHRMYALWQDIQKILANTGHHDLTSMWETIEPRSLPSQTPTEEHPAGRAPRAVLSLFNEVRRGAVQPPVRVGQKLFLAPEPLKWDYWEFRPHDSDLSLAMPIDPSEPVRESPAVACRTVLTPSLLKAYLASMCLALDHQKDGYFPPDYKRILFDYYGLPARKRTINGKMYDVPPSTPMRLLQESFQSLSEVYLMGTTNVRMSSPQPLLSFIARGDREVWQHASLVWELTREAFTQVPRAVLRLEPFDVPLALGVAGLWRHRIVPDVLKGIGVHRTTLHKLADVLGEDVDIGKKRFGPGYWPRLIERLTHTMTVGELGTVHASSTEHDAVVTLTPTETLAHSYRPLLAAQIRAAARSARVDVEVTARLRAPRKGRARS